MYIYEKNGNIVFDVAILRKEIKDLTSKEMNIYKLFIFLRDRA